MSREMYTKNVEKLVKSFADLCKGKNNSEALTATSIFLSETYKRMKIHRASKGKDYSIEEFTDSLKKVVSMFCLKEDNMCYEEFLDHVEHVENAYIERVKS